MTSHDMEDIVTIINGRKEIVDELQNSEQRLRNYVSEEFRNLLKDEDFLDAIEGYLNPDAASQARSKIVITRMQEIGKLGMEENHSA